MFHGDWTDIAQQLMGLNSDDNVSIIDLTTETHDEKDEVIILNEKFNNMPIIQSSNLQRERSCSPVIINDSSNSSTKSLNRLEPSLNKKQKTSNKKQDKIILNDLEDLNQIEEGVVKCPICLENSSQILKNGKKIVSTTCGHVFCESCLKASLRLNKSCPRCRKRLYNNSFHFLFF